MSPLTQFETREPREEEHGAHIIEVMRRRQQKLYPPGGTLRDAHTKQTALLEAEFVVGPDVPDDLRVGLFAAPASYRALVRFSNSSDSPHPDGDKDLRGVAIKLRGVPGERIAESDEADTQDFILMHAPAMPLGTVKLFHDAIYLVTERSPILFALKMLLTGHLKVLLGLRKVQVNPSSPLDVRYWSTTPYLFGPDRVAKYSLVPTPERTSAGPSSPPPPDYLTRAVQVHLGQADATFDFMVQIRTDPATMPVEDAAVRWNEKAAPFAKVATLRIPMQGFDPERAAALAQSLAFSPAHALVEHRPIGAINRVRMRVYDEQARWRQRRDGVERIA